MKYFILVLGCLISYTAASESIYQAPTTLTTTQAKKSEAELQNKQANIQHHWQARLAMAKQKNLKLAKSGTPLQRPYYGDFAGKSANHQH